MCDVDAEAVVSAVDAPSIYDIPKVLHAEGLDAYVVRRLGLPFRDVDWTVWGDLLDRVHHPSRDGHGRAGRQVRRPAGRLPVGDRGAAGRRVRAPGQGARSAGCPPTTAPTPAGAAAALAGVDGVLIPGGFGVRGIEGKVGAIRYAREQRHPGPRAVPRPAVHGDRGRPAPGRAGRCELHRVRPGDPAPGDRHDGRPGRRRRRRAGHGRHDAARGLPGEAACPARSSPRRTGGSRSPSGTGTGTR